ncbi:FUSC family protein [Salmonella enterica subsp. enterica serovar Newport]
MFGFIIKLRSFSPVFYEVVHDFSTVFCSPARLIDCGEVVLAVLLAIIFSHLLHVQYVGWAAFSGYMVMRGHVLDSLQRGGQRIAGTVLGAVLAVLVENMFPDMMLSSLILAAMTGITLYNALLFRHSYAWLFMGLTFAMVVMDGIQNGGGFQGYAFSRIEEVMVGTGASILVSALSTWLIRPRFTLHLHSGVRKPLSKNEKVYWHQSAFWHSVQAALAMVVLPFIWQQFDVVSVSQTCITIMAVMMVPLSVFNESKHPATTKIIHRFIGCLSGAFFGFIALIASHQHIWLLILLLTVGVIIGRIIENGTLKIRYIGTQFTLALLVILVPDHYAVISVAPGIERLLGIVFGIMILEPVCHVPWLYHKTVALFQKIAGQG